jgi:hypothetical protein
MIEQSFRDPFRILPRPEFSPEGEQRTGPNCKKESVFRPFQLFYSEEQDSADQI